MLVPMGIFYQNNLIQNLSFDIGFIIITLILYIRFPKYRLLTSMFLLAIFIFIFANFKDDESMQWTLISTAIAIIALGLSLQAFSSDEFTEQKLSKIDTIEKKLDEVIKRFPESPNINNQSSGIIVKKDKKKKNL
jgi:sulfite exporter TauE/SafE